MVPVEGGDHSLRVPVAAGGPSWAQIVAVTLAWALEVAAG